MNRFLFIALSLVAGCSSLVDGPCEGGYVREDGTCIARTGGEDPDAGPMIVETDAGPGSDGTPGDDAGTEPDASGTPDAATPDALVADATPDAPSCTAPEEYCDATCKDLSADPDNCGTCDHVCASGICTAGHCEGEAWGHIVAIGHDYTAHHASARRVLANAASLGAHHDLAIAWWSSPGAPTNGATTASAGALATGLAAINRPWHQVGFPAAPTDSFLGIDVIIVPPTQSDGDALETEGTQWATAFDSYLRTGGVIVVLDGANGTNYRFAHGANLFDVAAPTVVTGQPTAIVDASDAVAEQVVAPYLAEATSVSWPGALEPVVTTMGGTNTVVFHLTR